MKSRAYDAKKDREAAVRIWREVGWIDGPESEKGFDVFLSAGSARLAEVDGGPECMVNTCPGTLRYMGEEVPTCCVSGVTTSHVAKRQGLASRLLAECLAAEAEGGSSLAALGAFDQGFYDRLGFGTGGYDHWCTFDPAQLVVPTPTASPKRLTIEDAERIHRSRLRRERGHGAITVTSSSMTHAEILWSDNGIGLGFAGDDREITHHVWLTTKSPGGAPYRVSWMAYETKEQFLELMGILRSLADQVTSIRMREPAGIQLQDLLWQPFRYRRLTREAKHQQLMTASAYNQFRILDLEACIRQMRLDGKAVSFHLELLDPIRELAPEKAQWKGVGGEYTVHLGADSTLEPGRTGSLPTLRTTVNAFTRLWLGVQPASTLSWTDRLEAPTDLLTSLDRLRLPRPTSDWEF